MRRGEDIVAHGADAPAALEIAAKRHGGGLVEGDEASGTRNARLAAIRSFMRVVEHRVPAALDQVRRVRAIPVQRILRHLGVQEHRALLDAPEPTTRLRIRDRAMLVLALAGPRVAELVGLRLDEAEFNGRYVDVRVRGKGRRERALTLWKAAGNAIRAWLAVRGEAPAPELFLDAWRKAMTRSGFERVLAKHVAAAAAGCPSLQTQRVSPHVLAHLRAQHAASDTRATCERSHSGSGTAACRRGQARTSMSNARFMRSAHAAAGACS